jgi:hypothetical protein
MESFACPPSPAIKCSVIISLFAVWWDGEFGDAAGLMGCAGVGPEIRFPDAAAHDGVVEDVRRGQGAAHAAGACLIDEHGRRWDADATKEGDEEVGLVPGVAAAAIEGLVGRLGWGHQLGLGGGDLVLDESADAACGLPLVGVRPGDDRAGER